MVLVFRIFFMTFVLYAQIITLLTIISLVVKYPIYYKQMAPQNELDLYNYSFLCTRVIDADTLEGNINLGFKMNITKIRLRVAGIDAPEIRGPQKIEGLKVKEHVKKILESKELRIKSYYYDSFGRIIADVFFLNKEDNIWINLSAHLLELELVKVYV